MASLSSDLILFFSYAAQLQEGGGQAHKLSHRDKALLCADGSFRGALQQRHASWIHDVSLRGRCIIAIERNRTSCEQGCREGALSEQFSHCVFLTAASVQ